jgi:HTH-type transcriptional regulator, sugar sensing transcriptional regulator
VVILLGPEVSDSSTFDIVAIWADHAGLAGFAREYFEYLLKDSKKVS